MSDFLSTLDDLDAHVKRILDTSNTNRCSIYLRGGDERVHASYHKSDGKETRRDVPHDDRLLFQMASLFKAFIATSLVIIIDKLSLETRENNPYHKLAGAFDRPFTEVFNSIQSDEYQMPALPGEPSVKQLMVHYNGVYDMNHILLAPDGSPLQGLSDISVRISQYVEDTAVQDEEEEASKSYSNINYILLALLIDKASGSLTRFLQEYLFTPLRMNRVFLSIQDLKKSSSQSQRQPHVVSGHGHRMPLRPDQVLGLVDLVELAWLGPYISIDSLARFFEALQSARGGHPVGLLDKTVVMALGKGGSTIDGVATYVPLGIHTPLGSSWPGSHSINELISPVDDFIDVELSSMVSEPKINVYYSAGCATGWAHTVYFLPDKKILVIVLTNTSGPLDASDSISRLCLYEILGFRPPMADHNKAGRAPSGEGKIDAVASFRDHFVGRELQRYELNSALLRRLEQDLELPDTPTSVCPELLGTYYCDRNGQQLQVYDIVDATQQQARRRVLRVKLCSESKSSQEMRFVKVGERYRMCPISVLAIDCFGAWRNVDFDVKYDPDGVRYLSRYGCYKIDNFFQRTMQASSLPQHS